MSEIAWTRHTINPGVFGCAPDGAECDNCYAEIMALRQHYMALNRGEGNGYVNAAVKTAQGPKWTGVVRVEPERIAPAFATLPRAACAVFVTSMADLFHDDVPFDFIDAVFVEMERRPHWFQVLTKRPGNARRFLIATGRAGRLAPNVWIGTTAGDPAHGPRRLEELARVPARHLFVSMEPLLGYIDVRPYLRGRLEGGGTVGWVIVGGESGRRARPMHPSWAKAVRDACEAEGIPFFFKQWGAWAPGFDEADFTRGGLERRPHAWVDAHTAANGLTWVVDDDGRWSNWTGEPPMVGAPGDATLARSVTIMHRHQTHADLPDELDGDYHVAFPEGWTR